eukprot:m.312953 g.312953  ORF g.312953 m.312953 type:complete len:96 (+) comp55404_c0_seq3:130-417(+)
MRFVCAFRSCLRLRLCTHLEPPLVVAVQILETEVKQLRKLTTCSTCNIHQKDTVMLKCFHVFCERCIQGRYDRRERKCPACSNPFGANDFHKFFL